MAKSLNILFVTSEVYPLSKEGGIADVCFSLPLALREIGNDVRVMVPKYGCVSERKNKIHEIKRLKNIIIPMYDGDTEATIKSSSIQNPRCKVQSYITTNFTYFDSRKGVFHDPDTWKEYSDNPERFIFFCRSVVETCLQLGWFPDVIHCHDWHTALVPAYAKSLYAKHFKKTKFVLSVHNFERQGTYPMATSKKTQLPESVANEFIYKRQFNFLKGGVMYADYITTSSPTYANEILEDKNKSNGIGSLIKDNNFEFKGILNGIDPWVWNKSRDNAIAQKYESDFEEYKYHNKVALINKFGFEYHPRTPLIAMTSRIDTSKGIDLLISAMDKIMSENEIQFAFLGQGDSKLKKELETLSEKYPENFKVKFSIDDELARLMFAGSDAFVLTPQIEPSGLNFIYALAYGSVPVSRITGGLTHLVKPYNAETEEGNAIAFTDYTVEALAGAVNSAVQLFKNKEAWTNLIFSNFEEDHSWGENAQEYDDIYRKILKE